MEPRSGRSRPIRDFRKTDLPVPEGPSRALTSPEGSVNETSCQIRCEPKDFVTPSVLTSTPTPTSTILSEQPTGVPRNPAVAVCRVIVGSVTGSHGRDAAHPNLTEE